jgi:ribosomal protein S20
MKSAAPFLLMLLVSGIIFCILSSSTMTIVMTADAIRSRGGEDNKAKDTRVAISHSSNVKPIDTTSTLSKVKTNLEKAIHAITQGDKQNAVLQLKSANSQLASINTAAAGHGNVRSANTNTNTNTPSIQSVKISTTNAIQALQSHNIKVVSLGILHLKSAHSKLLSILDSSSVLSSVENLS